jgi:hypothetical protein
MKGNRGILSFSSDRHGVRLAFPPNPDKLSSLALEPVECQLTTRLQWLTSRRATLPSAHIDR